MPEPELPRLTCKAMNIWQPRASLIAAGLLRVETRRSPTSHRGLVAIHTHRGITALGFDEAGREPFRSLLERLGLTAETLPHARTLGVCELVACVLITEYDSQSIRSLERGGAYRLTHGPASHVIDRTEADASDFAPGLSAYLFGRARPFRRPYSNRGQGGRGLWTWTAPDNFRDLEPEIAPLLTEVKTDEPKPQRREQRPAGPASHSGPRRRRRWGR